MVEVEVVSITSRELLGLEPFVQQFGGMLSHERTDIALNTRKGQPVAYCHR